MLNDEKLMYYAIKNQKVFVQLFLLALCVVMCIKCKMPQVDFLFWRSR